MPVPLARGATVIRIGFNVVCITVHWARLESKHE